MAQPKEALDVKTKRITIDSNYNVSDQNVSIKAGDSIEFVSQANQDCSTSFTPSGVFGNQTVPANSPAPAEPTSSNQPPITVNYFILGPNGITTGPYSVSVDSGALPMSVDSYGNCSPLNAAIPNNGTIYFNYTQTGPNPPATITVQFTTPNGQAEFYDANNNPVTSQVLSPGNNGALQGRGNVKATYSFIGTEPGTTAGGGSGTIKVGSG